MKKILQLNTRYRKCKSP